jgi:hypothetical protein
MEHTVEDKIETQHQLLNSQLWGALRAAEGGLAVEAADRVNRLARTLELHLTLEEKHYFPERRAAQPDLADEIDRLIKEHGEFRRSLSEAVEKVSEGDVSGVSEILEGFAATFHQHERREHDLTANSELG